jgi:hypothetical protein
LSTSFSVGIFGQLIVSNKFIDILLRSPLAVSMLKEYEIEIAAGSYLKMISEQAILPLYK